MLRQDILPWSQARYSWALSSLDYHLYPWLLLPSQLWFPITLSAPSPSISGSGVLNAHGTIHRTLGPQGWWAGLGAGLMDRLSILVSDAGSLDSFSAGKQTQRRTLVVPFSLSLSTPSVCDRCGWLVAGYRNITSQGLVLNVRSQDQQCWHPLGICWRGKPQEPFQSYWVRTRSEIRYLGDCTSIRVWQVLLQLSGSQSVVPGPAASITVT